MNIADLRKEYTLKSLSEDNVLQDPLDQFRVWWKEAVESKVEEANAMTLATCDSAGNPTARIVLLKGVDADGMMFYTNYNSRKAQQLHENPKACLVFFWKELERQVRIEGNVSRVSAGQSDQYFSSRPVLSQLSAWVSPQSSVIRGREYLEETLEMFREKFNDGNIPRPEHWGGYRVEPNRIEFWQGRQSRLHDRILYSLRDGAWVIERLAP